jgi:hypothetical protein
MKNKHQQVVDLSNPNEGQYTSASTSAIKINPNMSKPIDLEQVKADAWEEGNQITEKYWQDYDENGGNEYPNNPYKQQ